MAHSRALAASLALVTAGGITGSMSAQAEALVKETDPPIRVHTTANNIAHTSLLVDMTPPTTSAGRWRINQITATVTRDAIRNCRETQQGVLISVGLARKVGGTAKSSCTPLATSAGLQSEEWEFTYVPTSANPLWVARGTLLWSDWSHLRDWRDKGHDDPRAPKVHVTEQTFDR